MALPLPPKPRSTLSSSYTGNPPTSNAPLGTETPPPPPPKPSSHEASRKGTPHTGSPLSLPSALPSSTYRESSTTQGQPGLHGDPAIARPPDSLPDDAFSTDNLPQPPKVEDGWLPDNLKDKSTPDLHSILQNPTLLHALATTHPSYPAMQTHLTTLLSAIKQLAKHLVSLEVHLQNLRASTESLLLHHQSLELSWRKKQSEMDSALEPWSPKALYQRLVAGIAEQEAVCRAVEESFLESEQGSEEKASEREVVEWVKRVRTEGARLESRREMRARWDEGRVGGWR
ncbi:Mod_r superfamily domain-containing protein [Histoplasma capsulatum G186AR]|uniref:Mod_r superfamily domain-containing protein n=1 Tax=Ajellomyces capsulatus TaxID=5037 RepID=A0A8H8D4N2_AJECA|nr:Mod_r superfamily domain-containing protein [Histoplasma capsulatum]QSS67731.1 Mod_r superfamily domain-containing protein [Histoplasma capsulatum G186AR]